VQVSLTLEVVTTATIAIAFIIFGIWAMRAIRNAEQLLLDFQVRLPSIVSYNKRVAQLALAESQRARWRIQAILCIMLLAYLFRAVFEIVYASSFVGVDRSEECGSCSDCQPRATVMSTWLELNPQIQITAYIAAGPLALSLALYGIRAGQILQFDLRSAMSVSPSHERGYLIQSAARS
jgi:hypothetical protein